VSERRNAGHFSVLGSRPHKGATDQERKRLLDCFSGVGTHGLILFPSGGFGSCRPVLLVPPGSGIHTNRGFMQVTSSTTGISAGDAVLVFT
jgi:hypothetical protein